MWQVSAVCLLKIQYSVVSKLNKTVIIGAAVGAAVFTTVRRIGDLWDLDEEMGKVIYDMEVIHEEHEPAGVNLPEFKLRR